MHLDDFITVNGLSTRDRKNIETMAETYGHRIDLDTLRVSGGWIVADITVSERTAAKFAERLRRQVRASFLRDGRCGIKVGA